MWRTMAICAALAVGGCATAPTPQTNKAVAVLPQMCVQSGSRLNPTNCAPGSSYTKQDVDSTGQVYTQNALKLLDPAVH